MKRTLLFLLGVVIIAGIIGTLAKRDPGYVLISYDGATLQTGLWVFLAGLAILGVSVWLLLRLWRGLFTGAARLSRWRRDRSLNKSIEHTSRGLLYLQEGNVQRAEKFLTSGLKNQPAPVVNYLHLARAANELDKGEEREKYLRLAEEADGTAKAAVAMARAELALIREDWHECLTALKKAPDSDRARSIKKSALVAEENWPELGELLPALKKTMSPESYQMLEATQVRACISDKTLTDEQKLKVFRSASQTVRNDVAVLIALAKNLQAEKEIETILRKAINLSWQSELVEVYGELGQETAARRLKLALGWQKQHPIDPSLSYCVGVLQEMMGETEQARVSYQTAIDKNGHRAASQRLANLYALDGDHKKSHEYLTMAYRGA